MVEVCRPLQSKHPKSQIPSETAIPSCDNSPYFEDSKITATHIHLVARRIQDGTGLSGCQSLHWRDALLQHNSSSRSLQEAVAALCRSAKC